MAAGDFLKARGILAGRFRTDETPEQTIRRMRDDDVLGMGAMLEEKPMPDRAVIVAWDLECDNCGEPLAHGETCPKCGWCEEDGGIVDDEYSLHIWDGEDA